MEISGKINYWIDLAGYDLDTAGVMLRNGRYLYVGFMCHQAVEKSLKAYYWSSVLSEPPYTHNLLLLAEQSKIRPLMTEDMDRLLNRLMPLNIQARYPHDKDELLKALTFDVCEEIFSHTGEFVSWIRQFLKK